MTQTFDTWIGTSAVETSQGTLVRVQGISELVRDTHAAFYSGLDSIEVLDPAEAKIVWDDSRRFRLSRLFLETTLRTTPAVETRMVFLPNTVNAAVLEKITEHPRIVDLEWQSSRGWDETIDRQKGYFEVGSAVPASWEEAII